MDLPEPLMKMMATLISSYEIHNWSIYSNNSKNTCLVIRFSDTDGCTQSAHYRRISNNQLARNNARSHIHKQNKMSDTNHYKRRKIDNLNSDSPELSRMPALPHFHDGFIDSPILPVKEGHFTILLPSQCHQLPVMFQYWIIVSLHPQMSHPAL